MIDAYTIGVTLALEDGVSDGILAIRRDLAQLDIAVAESAAKLIMLRSLTVEAGLLMPTGETGKSTTLLGHSTLDRQNVPPTATPAQTKMGAPAIPPSSPPPIVSPNAAPISTSQVQGVVPRNAPSRPIDLSVTGPSTLPPVMPAAVLHSVIRAPEAPLAPVAQIVAPAPVAATEPDYGVRPFDLAALARSLTPPAMASTPLPTLTQRSAAMPMPSQSPDAQVKSPSVSKAPSFPPIGTLTAPAPSPSPGSGKAPIAVQSTVRPHADLPLFAMPGPPMLASKNVPPASEVLSHPSSTVRPSSKPVSSAPRSGALRPESTQPAPSPSGSFDSPSTSTNYAPPVLVAARKGAVAAAQMDTERQRATDSPADSQQVDRPEFAELHLDGAALGRWITRYLERQVMRPQVGAAGFDSRMTPTWAGAPIGN
jgi:hypothetical protein